MSSATYRVELTRPAIRDLHRLPRKLADAALRFLEGPLSENPARVTKELHGSFEGMRSGYVGISYGVLVRIDESDRTVYVLRMAHRADAYR